MANEILCDATQADSDVIAALHVRSWQATYRGILPDRYLDDEAGDERRSYWQTHLSNPGSHDLVIVAREDTCIRGFISIVRASEPDVDVMIENLHVAPEAHSRGLGRRLIAAAVDRLVPRQIGSICLWVYDSNLKAIEFYQRLGGITDVHGTENFAGTTVPHSRVVFRDLAALRSQCSTRNRPEPRS